MTKGNINKLKKITLALKLIKIIKPKLIEKQ